MKDIKNSMPDSNKKVLVIGAGFAGLSAATFLAQKGWQVTVVEKHDIPGGRARKFEVDFLHSNQPLAHHLP